MKKIIFVLLALVGILSVTLITAYGSGANLSADTTAKTSAKTEASTDPIQISLQYDDYVTELKTIKVSDNPIITGSCLDVITKDGVAYFHAKGIGTATVKTKDKTVMVEVGKAKLHIMLVMGQSNAGNHFANAMSDVKCELGTAYWWPYNAPVTDHNMTTTGWHAPFLAEFRAQSEAAENPVKPVLI